MTEKFATQVINEYDQVNTLINVPHYVTKLESSIRTTGKPQNQEDLFANIPLTYDAFEKVLLMRGEKRRERGERRERRERRDRRDRREVQRGEIGETGETGETEETGETGERKRRQKRDREETEERQEREKNL